MPRRISNELELRIIEDYTSSKVTCRSVAEKYNLTTGCITAALRRNNIPLRRSCKFKRFTNEEKAKIKELYLSNNSSWKISKLLNTTAGCIWRYLRKINVPIRENTVCVRKYYCNSNFFNKIDSYAKSQILGLIYADGYIHQNSLNIGLKSTDAAYLNEIKQIMEFTGELKIYTDRSKATPLEMANLKITDKQIITDLAKLGVFNRKSLTIKFPTIEQVPFEYLPSFLLGNLEGDGCIHFDISRHRIAVSFTSGSRDFIYPLKEILSSSFSLHTSLRDRDVSRKIWAYSLRSSGNYQVIKFLSLLYSISAFRMERKYNLYLKAVDWYRNNNWETRKSKTRDLVKEMDNQKEIKI